MTRKDAGVGYEIRALTVDDLPASWELTRIAFGADKEAPPNLEDIFVFCTEAGLMTQKVPEQLEIVDVLPRNATGKVLKHELRKQYTAK